MNRSGDAFEVADIVAGGPAAKAGLKLGDRIVAIDGKSAKDLALHAVRVRLRSDRPGTKVRLTIESGGRKRDVTLVLKDLE